MKRLILPVVLAIALSGCAKLHYTPHPGAISLADSVYYDALIDAKAGIDEAKVLYVNGTLPPASSEYLNKAIALYNTAEATWQLEHAGVDSPQLGQQIQDLVQSLSAIESVFHVKLTKGGK